MNYNYNGVNVYYNIQNDGCIGRPIIFLHGWGRSGEDFKEIANFFEKRRIITIDFPPFGKSTKEPTDWNIFTYAGMLMSLCEKLNIENADFIGHSFGGRLLIIVAAVKRTLVHSCILVDCAGMKPRRSIKYRYNVLKVKLAKRFHRQTSFKGSADYQALSPQMKEVFKSVVNTFLEDYAKKIVAKTLIVWGLKDDQTPIYMAKRLKKLIKNSRLELLNGGHFCFLDCPLEFFSLVNDFLKQEA